MSVFKLIQAAVVLLLLSLVFLAETYINNPVIVEKLYLSIWITMMVLLIKFYSHKGVRKTATTNTY